MKTSKTLKKASALFMAACMFCGTFSITTSAQVNEEVHTITLKSVGNGDGTFSHEAVYDGAVVNEYDYTWHADPSEAHTEVKDSPSEYYSGTKPDETESVYIAHDIYYYPELDESGFKKVQYDDEQEWAYYYSSEAYSDYIFSTLPVINNSIPSDMMHSEAEAYQNAVLHITEAGTYQIEGEWHGQIWIDLGDEDETFTDEDAKVTIILNGVDVTCTVAPSLVFYSLYECDSAWEQKTEWHSDVDTGNAGANVIIADDTQNNFSGENVYRILKTAYKSDSDQSNVNGSVKLQKKRLKIDGAFYSYVSMNIDGGEKETGTLNVNAGFEGLDSDLHLTLNGGNVNIVSGDDGINVSEDQASVVTINGGALHILAGLGGGGGDGIDSNGFLVINGGAVISMASPQSDSGLDSSCGTFINGGTVFATGSTMDWAEEDESVQSNQAVMNLQFSSSQSAGDAVILTDVNGKAAFAYDPKMDETAGAQVRTYQGAILSSETIEIGERYYLYIGGQIEGEQAAGVYDSSTVTGFTDDAKQQCYTGTTVGGMGGSAGGQTPPGEFGGDVTGGAVRPDMPDNFGGNATGGAVRPDMPDNFGGDATGGAVRPDMPDNFGGDATGGAVRPDMPGDFGGDATGGAIRPGQPGAETGNQGESGTASVYFTITGRVNDFSGIEDASSQNVSVVTKGDLNGDGYINLEDAYLALEAALGITDLSGDAYTAADLYDNHTITLDNAQIILRAALGIIKLEDELG